MMQPEYEAYLAKRGLGSAVISRSVAAVAGFEGWLAGQGKALEGAAVPEIEAFIGSIMARRQNSMWRMLALARYFYATGNKAGYVYMASVVSPRGVLPELAKRVASIAGEGARSKAFRGMKEPPLGTPPAKWPAVTRRAVEGLEAALPEAACRRALAGNLHRIPASAFEEQRALFRESGGVDEFLRRLHARAIAEIESSMRSGRLWYEQEITPAVVALVRGNQEILSGVRRGDRIYVTKIPYDPKGWLAERDPLRRRYLACHCPLARESIISGRDRVPGTWCYCSAGFEKLQFEAAFGEELAVELLESVLAGGDRCRFAITIPARHRVA
jgi:hypothetical protein